MPVALRRRFRSKAPQLSKRQSTDPTSDTGDNTKMDMTVAETRKRTLVETTGADDDETAEKYLRAEDFVAEASMDELTGRRIIDENGIFDHDASEETWAAGLGAGGELDRQSPRRLRKRWIACWWVATDGR